MLIVNCCQGSNLFNTKSCLDLASRSPTINDEVGCSVGWLENKFSNSWVEIRAVKRMYTDPVVVELKGTSI